MFFDKPAKRLTLDQAALIAGLPQAPSQYNPFYAPEAAEARRNDVLQRMAKQRMITQAAMRKAQARPLGVHPGTASTRSAGRASSSTTSSRSSSTATASRRSVRAASRSARRSTSSSSRPRAPRSGTP